MTPPITRSRGSPDTPPVDDPEALLRAGRAAARGRAADAGRPEALSPRPSSSSDAPGSPARRVRVAPLPGFDLDQPASLSPATFFATDADGRRESLVTRLAARFDGTPAAFPSDLAAWRRLSAACLDPLAHADIRAEAHAQEPALAAHFIASAGRMPPHVQAAALRDTTPLIDRLLQRPHAESGTLDGVRDVLDDMLTVALHADARPVAFDHLQGLVRQLPPSEEKAWKAVALLQRVGLLPMERQRDTAGALLAVIGEVPDESLGEQAQVDGLAHPFNESIYALHALHEEAIGPSAIDLLRASRGRLEPLRFEQQMCHELAGSLVLAYPATGQIRFARLPDAHKLDLFLHLLDASIFQRQYQMGGARAWGPALLQHLPAVVRDEAAVLLQQAQEGGSPALGFASLGDALRNRL